MAVAAEFKPVRGFPMSVSYVESWADVKVRGQWPKLKAWTRAWSPIEGIVAVVVKDEDDKGVPDYPSDKELGLVAETHVKSAVVPVALLLSWILRRDPGRSSYSRGATRPRGVLIAVLVLPDARRRRQVSC